MKQAFGVLIVNMGISRNIRGKRNLARRAALPSDMF
jgi:hypothetical protein